jgi:hypothetical protein
MGIEAELHSLIGEVHAIELDLTELLTHFPPDSLTFDAMQRAAALGLIVPTENGKVRVADGRFLDTGSTLAGLGISPEVILDEWENLVSHTDDIAERFVTIFEDHLAPKDWKEGLDTDTARELATTLAQLQAAARQVLVAALDASVARLGRDRLGELIER